MRAAVYGRQSRGKEKSIEEQVRLCTLDAAQLGWSVSATYRDSTSASRYQRRARTEWPRVLAALTAGEVDALVLWASSRADRHLTSWSAMLDTARARGILIRVTDDDRTYDARRPADWRDLAQQGVSNAVDSDKISTAVRRGHAGAAAAGKPPGGRAPYGYRRTYDPATGERTGQEPDPATAPIVREIIKRVSLSEPISEIAADLDARGIASPKGGAWTRKPVRYVATNPAYLGRRVHRGSEYAGTWPALVDEATYYAAQRVLAGRKTTRPGAQRHLLSHLAVCDQCERGMGAGKGRYQCPAGHTSIQQAPVDELVTLAVIARLSDPAVYGQLRQAGDDADQAAVEAWADVAKLTAQLDEWRRSAARGQTTPESLAAIEGELTPRIKAAERRAERASNPPALRAVLEPGVDVGARWAQLTLPAKREVIQLLVDLRISQAAHRGLKTFDPSRLDNSRWRGDALTWGERGRSTVDK